MGGARPRERNTGLDRSQFPRNLSLDPEHTRGVVKVCMWVRSWNGGSKAGLDRSQFPSLDHTAPRVVRVGAGTTTTPATAITESVAKIMTYSRTTEMEYRLPGGSSSQIRLVIAGGWWGARGDPNTVHGARPESIP